MTPRARVEAVLRGEVPDQVPLTIYESKIPQCAVERQLRNEGLCIVYRTSVYTTHMSHVETRSEGFELDGIGHIRTIFKTPFGELEELARPADFTSWNVEKRFKGPEDYRALQFMVEDQHFEEDYAAYLKREQALGEDFILRAAIGLTPLHQIMIHWMGLETFAIEWSERRDEVLALYAAMVDKQREIYRLVARSPASHANYGGNEVPEVMGLERFEQYCIPLYEEAAAELHQYGVLLGSHLDGNNKLWAHAVAASSLDYVEALTPPPDCDTSVREALDLWPDKFIWINFPSSVHVETIETIEETTRELLHEAAPGERFIMGITEDIPEERWRENMLAISRVIGQEGQLPLV